MSGDQAVIEMYMMFGTRYTDGLNYRNVSLCVFQISVRYCSSALCRIHFSMQDVLPCIKLVMWYCIPVAVRYVDSFWYLGCIAK